MAIPRTWEQRLSALSRKAWEGDGTGDPFTDDSAAFDYDFDAHWERELASDRAKRGDAIFEGTDYPRTWDGFVGQEKVKEQLRIMVGSAKSRGTRIEHTLLASGIAGVGKSTLAALIAFQAGAGLVQTTGEITSQQAREILRSLRDGDVWFVDEAHLLTQGSRTKSDWLLPLMTEGKLNGERMPDVAVIAATTDLGRLPETLISRFMVQPAIRPYSDVEGTQIARSLAHRMELDRIPDEVALAAVAKAADNNPRVMRQILTQVRDIGYAYPETFPNLSQAFDYAGVSPDGLSVTAREILLALLLAPDHTAAIDTIRAQLNEPGPIRHHEQQLLQRQFVDITGRGRRLTDLGLARARMEAGARHRT